MTIQEIEQQFLNHIPSIMGVKQQYAVLVPLVEQEGELHLLLEVRSKQLRSQPGDVCFPGGRMELGESATHCAFRETWEELGISASAIRPIARLDQLHHGSFLLHPLLAQVDEVAMTDLTLNGEEVDHILLVPLSFFQKNPPQVYIHPMIPQVDKDFPYALIGHPEGQYRWRRVETEVPIWDYHGTAIWGMTARIIKHLLAQMEIGDG